MQSCSQGCTVQGLEQPQLSEKSAKSLFSSLCFMAYRQAAQSIDKRAVRAKRVLAGELCWQGGWKG